MKGEPRLETYERLGECAQCPNRETVAPGMSANSGRRRFLNYLLGTGFGATALAIFYPILKFLTPPRVIEAAQNSVTAGKLGDLALNSGKIFKFGNKPGILIRSASGELKAFSAVCTHLDCIVQYQPEKKQICAPVTTDNTTSTVKTLEVRRRVRWKSM